MAWPQNSETLTYSDVQDALVAIVESYVEDVQNALVDAGYLDKFQPIAVYRGPLAITPSVPSVEVVIESADYSWGALRTEDWTFTGHLALRIENLKIPTRNRYLAIFEGTLRRLMNDIDNLQFNVNDSDGNLLATVYDSKLTQAVFGESAQGAFYMARLPWTCKVWMVKT